MASVTAEVMLHFGVDGSTFDGKKFQDAVTKMRFLAEPEMTSSEIIDLITPVWWESYSQAKEE